MDELKVTFYLKKNEERADRTMPILGRIRIGKSMVQFSTKVYAIPELWNVKSGRAVGKSKPATAVNRELDRISVDIRFRLQELAGEKGKRVGNGSEECLSGHILRTGNTNLPL